MIEVSSIAVEDGLLVIQCTDSDYDLRDPGRFGEPVMRTSQFIVPTNHPRYRKEIRALLGQIKDLAESVYDDFGRSPVYVPDGDDDEEDPVTELGHDEEILDKVGDSPT